LPAESSALPMKNLPKRILVISLPGIGDTINSTPIYRPLRRTFPDAHITALVMYGPCREVLETNPFINEVLLWEFLKKGAAASLRFLLQMRRRRFDLSIMCYPANRKEYNLVSLLIGARLRLSHRYSHLNLQNLYFLNNRTIMERPGLHNVEENLRLLSMAGVPVHDEDKALSLPLLPEDEAFAMDFTSILPSHSLLIGMHAWSTTLKNMHRKCWPSDNFAELADRLKDNFDCEILLFQGPHDEETNRRILKSSKATLYVAKDTTVRQSAALMKECDLFITNDSGPMHMAAAAGARIVAVFGPTDPDKLHPWTEDFRIVRTAIGCSPCFYYSPRPLECERGDFACLTRLTVDLVYESVADALKEIRP
jgi:heptosyltransferase-2